MLKQLHIRDFVLIDDVGLAFGPGFTVLSGETGAGKSIIVSALELLLGGRGDNMLVRRGAEKARLEAVFDVGVRTLRVLEDEGFDGDEEEIALRREIGAEGRSRCYVNNRPATVAQLASLTSSLVDLHGQFADLPALKRYGQTELLDDYAGLAGERAHYELLYRRWLGLVREKRGLLEARAEREVLLDGLAFMINELSDAALREGEEEQLLETRSRVRHAVRIAADVEGASALLSDGEGSVTARLASARKLLADLAEIFPTAAVLLQRADEVAGAADELTREVAFYRPVEDSDPPDLDALEGRLALIERLKRKYAFDVAGLLAHLAELQERREVLGAADDRLQSLDDDIRDAAAAAGAAATELTTARTAAARDLEREVTAQLPVLGMEGGRFDVALIAAAPGDGGADFNLGPWGAEEATFMFTANPGEPLRPLAKVASGGELSRVMLAVRAASAGRAGAETIIFDEIDVGVGGNVGHAVGERLRAVAAERQVVCVTHLAQIAARADAQYHVDKFVAGERARVTVEEVAGDARVAELARMLGGGRPPTAVTLKHAEELLATVRGQKPASRRGGKP